MERRKRINNILKDINPLNKTNRQNFSQGFKDDYSLGREDFQTALYKQRELEGKQKEMPRGEALFGTWPGLIRAQEALGKAPKSKVEALKDQQMQLRTDLPLAHQIGQFVGTAAADLTQDASRSVYWLINAQQAAADLVTQAALHHKVPELWGKTPVTRPVQMKVKGGKKTINRVLKKGVESDIDYAVEQKLLIDGKPKRGYSWSDGSPEATLQKRNYSPGMLAALSIPTGAAVNNGLGLLTPFGGAEGFKANNPSEEDPTKTNNVIAEVAQKYILGKTGGMLPYDEFKKIRPDVSLEEYKAYQADKYNNSEDWNPLDGDVALLGGAFKANVEGVLGPEFSILGRSLPVTTGLLPATAAGLGTVAGAYYGHKKGKGAMGGLVGGLASAVGGAVGGSIIEGERRRRNGIENGELPLS